MQMRIQVPADHQLQPTAYVASSYARGILAPAFAFSKATYEHSVLSLREFEAARARTAQINGCLLCQNWRSDRDTVAYLESLGGAGKSIAPRGGEIGRAPCRERVGQYG